MDGWHVVVATDGPTVLGTATMGPNRPGRGSHIANASFMVDPAHQGCGVGRALGRYLVEWARQAGYHGIQFNAVVETNTVAVRLGRSLGFEIIGTVPEAFNHPVHGRVGLHVMYRRLTPAAGDRWPPTPGRNSDRSRAVTSGTPSPGVTCLTATAWELEPSQSVAYGSTVTAESIDEAPARESSAGRTTGQSSSTRRGTGARRSTAAPASRSDAGSTTTPSSDADASGPVTTSPVTTGPASTSPASTGSATTSPVTTDDGAGGTTGQPLTIPAPADPPTTELRSTLARPTEAPYGVTDRVPVVGPLPSNIYRARRPGVAVLLIIPAVAVGVLLVRALATAAFGDSFDIAGILASVCALVSLPFLVAGLYGLISGAAHGAEQYGFRVWARPPLAYLLVGLAFVAAAGLAIG
jgi:GNAT superfamily N-acetyltransferase